MYGSTNSEPFKGFSLNQASCEDYIQGFSPSVVTQNSSLFQIYLYFILVKELKKIKIN